MQQRNKHIAILFGGLALFAITSCTLFPNNSSNSSGSSSGVSSNGSDSAGVSSSAGDVSSSGTTTSSGDSSSATPSNDYVLVRSADSLIAGVGYLISDSKTAGSAYFLSKAIASNYYLKADGGTISGNATIPSDTTLQPFVLGGSSGAYTFAVGSSFLASKTSYPADILLSSTADTWTMAFDSADFSFTLQDNVTADYLEYNSTKAFFDCSGTASPLYLFAKESEIPSPIGLASSLSAVSLLEGATDSSISLTPRGFSATPSYSCVPLDSSICSASVTNKILSIKGLKAGSTTLVVTATNGTEKASISIGVTVKNASGAYLSLTETSLSLVEKRASGSVTAKANNMSGTVAYSATSSSSTVASVSINSTSGVMTVQPLSKGSATVTVRASDGTTTLTATCAVAVSALPTPTIALSASALSVLSKAASTLTISATGFDNNSGVAYSAKSSNAAVATASVTGNVATVTGVSAGTATLTITGTYTDSYGTQAASAACAVTVTGSTSTYVSPYRIAAVKASGTTANVYKVDWDSSKSAYVASVYKTLNTSADYIEQEDVAAYFDAFESAPRNYTIGTDETTVKNGAKAYGTAGRCGWSYTWGSYSGSNDYSLYCGNIVSGATYYELDIGTPTTNSGYNNGSGISRGAFRVVAIPGAATHDYASSAWSSGYQPVSFYSPDHYKTFYEYYNCVRTDGAKVTGFGAAFRGTATSVTSATRVIPTTITYA